MALPSSSDLRWSTFSGPYSRLLGVRVVGWSKRYKECMSTSAEAQDNLENIKASIEDLVLASPRKKEKKLMDKS